MQADDMFHDLSVSPDRERFDALVEEPGFILERIVSAGHATPGGEWLEEDTDEWVLLLKGSAGLVFEGEEEAVVMTPGRYLHIPAHRRHRVEWTDGKGETVWLALHYRGRRPARMTPAAD